jgi:hypothetical protein
LVLVSEVANLLFDSSDGAAAIFGELLKNAEWFQHACMSGGDFFGKMSGVKFAEQSANGLQADRVRVAAKKALAGAKFRNEPDAHETTFHSVYFQPERGFKRRKLRAIMDDPREPLLWITNLEQRREALLLGSKQRARMDVNGIGHGRRRYEASGPGATMAGAAC